jgi:hypothetical protein
LKFLGKHLGVGMNPAVLYLTTFWEHEIGPKNLDWVESGADSNIWLPDK